MGILLYLLAYVLFFPLTFINWLLVENKKGYFRDTALNIDKFANKEFRTLWNKTLITSEGYNFGDERESISGVLGKNILTNSLSKIGKILVWILSKKHCNDSIINF